MWLENLGAEESWMGVWKGLFRCGNCRGLIYDNLCPLCGFDHATLQVEIPHSSGAMVKVPQMTVQGAIEWSTYSFLNLIQREWERLELETDAQHEHVPQKLMVVVLFWTLFENLMDRFFRDAMRKESKNIRADLLKRYAGIGARLDRLYQILFNTSFKDDLSSLGYSHIYEHLKLLQDKRNDLMHGDPEAIEANLIHQTIEYFQDVQKAWIELYNKRCRLP